MPKEITINPSKQSDLDEIIKINGKEISIGNFLHQKLIQLEQEKPSRKIITYINIDTETTIKFTYTLVRHLNNRAETKIDKEKREYDYYIFNDQGFIDKGGYGSVFTVVGKLQHANETLIFQPDPNYVVKKQEVISGENPKTIIKAEYKLIQHLPHLNIQKPVFLKTSAKNVIHYSFTIMNKLSGITLYDFIMGKEIDSLNICELLAICLNAAIALKEQAHKHSIIHRDIKTNNLLIDVTSKLINLLDYGLSIEAKSKPCLDLFCHDPKYEFFAPEHRKIGSTYTLKSDIYSLTIIFIYILDRKKQYLDTLPHRYTEKNFNTIFSDTIQDKKDGGLKKQDLKNLKNILRLGVSEDIKLRPDIDEMIALLGCIQGKSLFEINSDILPDNKTLKNMKLLENILLNSLKYESSIKKIRLVNKEISSIKNKKILDNYLYCVINNLIIRDELIKGQKINYKFYRNAIEKINADISRIFRQIRKNILANENYNIDELNEITEAVLNSVQEINKAAALLCDIRVAYDNNMPPSYSNKKSKSKSFLEYPANPLIKDKIQEIEDEVYKINNYKKCASDNIHDIQKYIQDFCQDWLKNIYTPLIKNTPSINTPLLFKFISYNSHNDFCMALQNAAIHLRKLSFYGKMSARYSKS